MRKIPFLAVIVGLCLIFSESVSYGFGINISPPSLHITAKPGGTTSGTITVINADYDSVGVTGYAEDWLYSADGSKSFSGAGTTPLSCAKWIRLFPKKFQLEGKKKMGVQYTIDVPPDAKGGYYAVIFFESMPLDELEKEEGMVVQFAGRLGTIVYVEIEGRSIYKGDISSLEITPPQSNKPFEMKLLFKNTGNVYIGAKGILNIVDGKGNVLGKGKFGPLNTLPGDTREAKVEWFGELKEGTYYAVLTLDIGTEEPIIKEVKFDVSYDALINALLVDVSKEQPSFSVLVKNTGHLNIDAGGRIDILKDGKIVKKLELKKSLIAPGKEKELVGVLEEALSNGLYTAKAVISIGDKELTKEEAFSIR